MAIKSKNTVAYVGADAVAEAMRQINPDVVAAYPITPQTDIVQTFSGMVADGLVDTEMVNVESEHSAMSAVIGSVAAGSRAMTCTSSQGLALMWEMLYIASGLRLPIVMPNVNRALSAPINIHCDHSDSMGARDSGWIQLYSENAQEAYDNMIQAVRITEHSDVYLPAMVLLDGFIISHAIDRMELLEDDKVKNFVGEITPPYAMLDPNNPVTVGAFDGLYGYYFEFKRQQEEAMRKAFPVVKEIGEEFGKLSGRSYGFFEEEYMEDAEFAFLALGSAAGTVRHHVKKLRENGVPAGLIKLRMFRPFPAKELVEATSHLKALAVMDRSEGFAGGIGGPVFNDVRSAYYEAEKKPLITNYVYGLGGRDLSVEMVEEAAKEMQDVVRNGEVKEKVIYLGLKE